MNRAARLQSAAGWLKRFEGSNLVRSYARWFGVDLACALEELRRLGVELDAIYVARLETTLRNRPPRATRRAVALGCDDPDLLPEDLSEPAHWDQSTGRLDECPF